MIPSCSRRAYFIGTRQGFEKVDLTGELGIKAYFAGLTYERPFAYNTWHLYSRNTVNAASLSRNAARIDWYDASQYEAEPLDYLDEESAWQGEAVSLLSADANTNLTALLENTYRNAQPVLLQTAEALYAAFLRGNAETGQVAVCVTRFDGAGWEEPVQADADAILDDAPALCAAADGTVWLAYARSTADPQEDLLTYAENQSIVVGRIDPETLEFTESTTYPGQSYAHLQQLTAVNGQPVLVWADSEVPDADSMLFSPRSRICTAEWSGDAWSEAREIAQVDKPVLALAAGELDGTLAAAYLQDRDGASDTTADHDLYQLTDGEAICMQENVLGKLSFGAIPGQDSAGFLWNDADALCSNLGSVSVPGITSEYAVTGDSIYYSSATGANANLFVVKYQDEQWSAPIQLTKDGTRYLENLSAVRWNERDFVLGMHTYAAIYDSVMTYKNLVWAVVQPVSDLRLESVDYEIGSACAGESVPVTLSVYNAGDHAVTQIDILCDGTKQQTASCTLQPGAYGEFEISLTCPESCTEYTFRVEETGKSGDDFTPDDNIGTVRLGYADVSVALTEERVGTSRSAVAILTNQGVETASGTLIFADADGNHIGFIPFEELPSGDAAVSILPLADGFRGTVTVSALLDQPEWYTYNNTALLSVVRMTEPTTIRSAQISGGQVIVQFASTENASCTACCALYDAYGKLLKLTEASISPGEQEIRFDTAGTFDTAKIFLLDAAFTPLCEALTLKAT